MSRSKTVQAVFVLVAAPLASLWAVGVQDNPKFKSLDEAVVAVSEDVGDIVKEINEAVGKDKDIFTAEPIAVSISGGGIQTLTLDFGVDQAKQDYVIAGSISGVFPGTVLGTVNVPLNYDSYTDLLLARMSSDMFPGFSGTLDQQGRATAQVILPKTLTADLVGTVFFHAAVLFDPKTGKPVLASEVVELVVMP